MDYEKAYKNLVAKVKNAHLFAQTDSTKNVLEDILPELRESEDERIIRAIIDALYSHTNSINLLSSRGYQMENIEAWLEKQKYDRMKPIYDARESFESALEKAWNDYHNGYENVDKLEDDYVECAHAKGFREGYLFGIEKQKEQKSISQKDFDAAKHEALWDEQKPAEKQDYSGLNDLERAILRGFLAAGIENVPVAIIKETAHECLEQMKPAEWSEKDDWKRKELIQYLEEKGDYRTVWMTWLKSLRPSWKPSEEQMDALKELIDDANRAGWVTPGATELYEQLKKLM